MELIDILVCPQCKQKLVSVEGDQGLLCKRCSLKYPVREGIPVMLIDEALSMRSEGGSLSKSSEKPQVSVPLGGTQVFHHKVNLRVIGGSDEGVAFDLKAGQCRAMGRSSVDPSTKTTVMSVDWAISLDEETKGLVLQYISQQFRKPMESEIKSKDRIGAFKRAPDIVFNDNAMSRLHAMIFFDEIGVGILDLVSKNGTYVNGDEIESRLLKSGDTIEMGETKIIFEG